MTAMRPLPVTDDRESAGFYEAAARGELALLFCDGCERVQHLPRQYCSACGSRTSSWRAVAPTGRLYSWTVAEHTVHPAFPAPYTVVLVDVDGAPGARLLGYLPGAPELAEGQAMEAWFEDAGEGVVLPQWRPA